MASERDYPYDAAAQSGALHGLEKLRAVRDRELAGTLFRLFYSLRPDLPKSEVYDPATYGDEEPELSELHDPAGARAEEHDRACAAVHFAWKEFYSRMEDFESEHGRRLTQRQRQEHEYRFGGRLIELYGRSHATPTWEGRRREWLERVVGRGGPGAQS